MLPVIRLHTQHARHIALTSGIAFLALFFIFKFAPPPLTGTLDSFIEQFIHPFQTYVWLQVFLGITEFGSVSGIIAIGLGVAYFMRKNRSAVLRLLVALIGSTLMSQGIKILVARVRPMPLPWIGTINSYSFPSGHATSSMVLYGFIAIVAYASAKSERGRLLAIMLPGLLIMLIGVSRIVLGVHFLSDVLGGWFLGAFWLSVVWSLKLKTLIPTKSS